jgi:ribonucleoside-triphosphate reductase
LFYFFKGEDMRTIGIIDEEIQEVKEQLNKLKGTPTEVYTRIVGYYRAVENWNRGKREEYRHRICYDLPSPAGETRQSAVPNREAFPAAGREEDLDRSRPVSYLFFYRDSCPNCPPVSEYLNGLALEGRRINTDADEGLREALSLGVMSAPMVIFYDALSREIMRTGKVREIRSLISEEGFLSRAGETAAAGVFGEAF